MKDVKSLSQKEEKLAKDCIRKLTDCSFVAKEWTDHCDRRSGGEYTQIFVNYPKWELIDKTNAASLIDKLIIAKQSSNITIKITHVDLEGLQKAVVDKFGMTIQDLMKQECENMLIPKFR
jgi:hypothetical protein